MDSYIGTIKIILIKILIFYSKELFFLTLFLLFSFVFFEIILKSLLRNREAPIFSFKDLLLFQLLGPSINLIFGLIFTVVIFLTNLNLGLFNISSLHILFQIIILYLSVEFIIFLAHRLSHKKNFLGLYQYHKYHHSITKNMDWVNSRKESLIVSSLFVIVFCLVFYVLFKSSQMSNIVVVVLYLFLNNLSHYRYPFSIKYLDKIFLFPKEHQIHHLNNSGPYGVTLSLFDTIFKLTQNKKI